MYTSNPNAVETASRWSLDERVYAWFNNEVFAGKSEEEALYTTSRYFGTTMTYVAVVVEQTEAHPYFRTETHSRTMYALRTQVPARVTAPRVSGSSVCVRGWRATVRTSNPLDRYTDYYTPNTIVPPHTDTDYCESCGVHWSQPHTHECDAA